MPGSDTAAQLAELERELAVSRERQAELQRERDHVAYLLLEAEQMLALVAATPLGIEEKERLERRIEELESAASARLERAARQVKKIVKRGQATARKRTSLT